MVLAIVLLLVGIALLYAGGELLVDSAVRLARSFHLSSMVIGLTVVAFGTSCPELAATLTAAYGGAPDIAVSTAFGSNVANLGLILGISAIFRPFRVTGSFLRREVAFMIAATLAVYPMMLGGTLSRLEGLVLFATLVAAIVWTLKNPVPADEHLPHDTETDLKPRPIWLSSLGVAGGVGILVIGAQSLIHGARTIAEALGVSQGVIGFTMVALGTSLPELAASIVATKKGEGDIVMGNLVGSNIFNLLCILGLTAVAVPIPVNPVFLERDYWAMLGVSLLLLLLLASNRRLVRLEGVLLLLIYLGYSAYLYVAEARDPGAEGTETTSGIARRPSEAISAGFRESGDSRRSPWGADSIRSNRS